MLDLGTGSGILAIAAAKLGYSPIYAIDNDPEAVRIARQNGRRNRIERKMVIECKDLSGPGEWRRKSFDVVCANLIANVLITESAPIAKLVRAGGSLIAAGILNREFEEVSAIFRGQGLHLLRSGREGEWRSGVYQKNVCS
jgi:ribosomal protein L11 methyltransferase